MDPERPGIFGDFEIVYAPGLADETRQRGKPGGGDDDARDAGLLGFSRRPRRGRSTGSSGSVARDDRIAAPLPRQRRHTGGMPALLRGIVASRCMRKFRVRNDLEPGMLLLQALSYERKGDIALENPVPDLADCFSGEGTEALRFARPLYRVLAFGADNGDLLRQLIAP